MAASRLWSPETSDDDAAGLRRLRPWTLVLLVALIANGIFLAFNLVGAAVSSAHIAERVKLAFASGDLTDSDYHWWDHRLGFHHYADCSILQMLVNDEQGLLAQATGPLLYYRDEGREGMCPLLRDIVETGGEPQSYVRDIYVRHWHGYNPVTAALLGPLELGQVRTGLAAGVYLSLALFAFAAIRRRRLLGVTGCMLAVMLVFWALPYFAPSLSHAPGEAWLLLGLACVLLFGERLLKPELLLPFAAVYGAGLVYFEYFIGLLPTAAGFLFPLVYLTVVASAGDPDRYRRAWLLAIATWTAFVIGGAATVVINQVLGALFADPQALGTFSTFLLHYLGSGTDATGAAAPVPAPEFTFIELFVTLLLRGATLTYGSKTGAAALWLVGGIGWLVALWLAWRRRTIEAWSDFLAFTSGPLAVLAWVVLFSTHTFIHADFIVRIMIVPLALGWGAALWQYRALPAQSWPG
jgi:hypothetical protein